MRIIPGTILAVSLLFASAIAVYAMGESKTMSMTGVGKPAADFTLDTLTQKAVNMTQYRQGKKAIVFFWATWCPHCRDALKDLNKNLANIEGKGIKVILVDVGEEEKEVKRYMERNKIGATVFLDRESSLADPYGIIGVPTFVLVDSKGVVRAVEHALPDNYEEILAVKKTVKN